MEQTLNVIGGYGALGACLIYFMYKDINRATVERDEKKETREQFKEVVVDFRNVLQEIRDMLLKKGTM